MKIIFSNQYELLEGIMNGHIEFDDVNCARNLINFICTSIIEQSDSENADLFDFFGQCEAWDITEWCKETLEFNGFEIDWYDIITMSINSNELYYSIITQIDLPYSMDQAIGYIEDIEVTWRTNILNYLKEQLSDSQIEN